MKTLYETILDISDEQFDKAEQHPRIILDRVRKLLWDCFKGCLDLGYPIEDSNWKWLDFEYGDLEMGNIKNVAAFESKLSSFVSKLKKEGLRVDKIDKQKTYAQTYYALSIVLPQTNIESRILEITFTVTNEGSRHNYFIMAPKILLQ